PSSRICQLLPFDGIVKRNPLDAEIGQRTALSLVNVFWSWLDCVPNDGWLLNVQNVPPCHHVACAVDVDDVAYTRRLLQMNVTPRRVALRAFHLLLACHGSPPDLSC